MELLERIRRHARDAPEKIAVREVGGGERALSYRDLIGRADERAKRLKSDLPGSSVVMLNAPNSAEFHVWFLAIFAAGCSSFPFSADAVEPEIVAAAKRAHAAARIGPDHELHTLDADHVEPTPTLLLQTSGTTGHPGIARRPAPSVDAVARNMVEAIGWSGRDHVLTSIPLTHSYGLEHGLIAPLMSGATVHLCRSFNLAVVLEELARGEVTLFPGVPSIFEMLGRLGDENVRFPSLRTAYSAGAVLPLRVAETMSSRFGVRVGQVYGTTEVGSVTFNDPHASGFDPTSAGLPMRDVIIRTVTLSGVSALVGTEGQVQISAPSMFNGYVGGDGTEIKGGFFSTGDIGRISTSDHLTITGRHKLLIDVGGLKVNPIEVEQLLLEHPSVGECVVVPIALSETVNRLKAVIIPRQESDPPAPEELTRFARARLTAYKVPRQFEIRQSLPKTATGKVLRHLIEA